MKQGAESLILSKLNYRNIRRQNASLINKKGMQKKLNGVSSFAINKCSTESDVINANWMSSEKRLKYDIYQVAYKSLTKNTFLNI